MDGNPESERVVAREAPAPDGAEGMTERIGGLGNDELALKSAHAFSSSVLSIVDLFYIHQLPSPIFACSSEYITTRSDSRAAVSRHDV